MLKESKMNLKTFLTAAILSLAPLSAMAMCTEAGMEQHAMSCIEGTQWDAESGTCTPVTTS